MKKSIIFGVLAMFAVSAMSIQNVNAQNGTTAKKEAVKQDSKQKPSKPTQAINEPKAKPQINQEDKTSKGAPIHKAKGNTSKNTMKKDGKMQKESNQQNVNVNGNGKTEGKAVKPGQKNDAKAEIKKEGQPAMRTAQPQQKTDVKAQKKEQKPDYNTANSERKPSTKVDRKNANQPQPNAIRPKMKKDPKTEKQNTGADIK